jgi:hypothetical protein
MDITYGVGYTLDGWHVDMVVHLLGWPINMFKRYDYRWESTVHSH